MKANKNDKKKLEDRLTAEPKESNVSFWFLVIALLGVIRGLLAIQSENFGLACFSLGLSLAAVIYFVYKKIKK